MKSNKTNRNKQIDILKYQLKQKDLTIRKLNKEIEKFEGFKRGYIWKGLQIYRSLKKYPKAGIKSLLKEGLVATLKKIYRRVKNPIRGIVPDTEEFNKQYKIWLENNYNEEIFDIYRKKVKEFEYTPLISIIMPVYNVEKKWLKQSIESVRNQIYKNWELCIADDASTKPYIKGFLLDYKNKDKRIKVIFRKMNGHISRASNSALKLAEGEFIGLLDNDDILHPHTLYKIVECLNEDKHTDFIYSDEDKLTTKGKRAFPFFKPDWSPDLLLTCCYVSHFSIIRREIVEKVKGFRPGYEGSQDHDLFIRVTELTQNIKHIPDVLYSWRMIPGSTAVAYDTKGYTGTASFMALNDALTRRELKGKVKNGVMPGMFRIKYKIINNPLISIIIPTKDKVEYLQKCIDSIIKQTSYKNYEIIIVDNGSSARETLEYFKSITKNKKIKIIKWDKKFNYSSINNFGVRNARGEYILLLNNDTEIINKEWLSAMLEHAQRKSVGAVGAKLLYPNKTIQHAGIVLGIGGVAEHIYKGYGNIPMGTPVYKDIIRNYSAVTGACLMVEKSKYYEVKGLDPKFRIAFNDVDFCLKLIKKGYFNVYTPYAKLYHKESVTTGKLDKGIRDLEEFKNENFLMLEKWGNLIKNDPYFNPNLELDTSYYNIKTNCYI